MRTANRSKVHGGSWRAMAALLVAVALTGAGCSKRDDFAGGSITTTTRLLGEDSVLNGDATASGAEAVKQIEAIAQQLVTVRDPCKLLSNNKLSTVKLDASTLTSAAARKALSKALNDVYGHAQTLVDDTNVKAALAFQLSTFQKSLDLVNKYVGVPTDANLQSQFEALLKAPEMLAANDAVTKWLTAKCAGGAT